MEQMPRAVLDAPGWGLRARQALAIVVVELRKILGGKRMVTVCLLASLPVIVVFLIAIEATGALGRVTAQRYFGNIYSVVVLGATVFFGCALVFTQLYRGEILRRSLHFYLLAPVRREVLTVAKYAAGLLAVYALFGGVTVLVYPMFMVIVDLARGTGGPEIMETLKYLGITLLGCTAYGAVFLLFGTLFRNPILPVAGLLGWEALNFLLPSGIRVASVSYHLKSLLPVPGPIEQTFGGMAQSPTAATAVLSLLVLSAVAVALACYRVRRMEIRYTDD